MFADPFHDFDLAPNLLQVFLVQTCLIDDFDSDLTEDRDNNQSVVSQVYEKSVRNQ